MALVDLSMDPHHHGGAHPLGHSDDRLQAEHTLPRKQTYHSPRERTMEPASVHDFRSTVPVPHVPARTRTRGAPPPTRWCSSHTILDLVHWAQGQIDTDATRRDCAGSTAPPPPEPIRICPGRSSSPRGARGTRGAREARGSRSSSAAAETTSRGGSGTPAPSGHGQETRGMVRAAGKNNRGSSRAAGMHPSAPWRIVALSRCLVPGAGVDQASLGIL